MSDGRFTGRFMRGNGRWLGWGRSTPEFEGTHPEAQISEDERKAAMKRLAEAEAAEKKKDE